MELKLEKGAGSVKYPLYLHQRGQSDPDRNFWETAKQKSPGLSPWGATSIVSSDEAFSGRVALGPSLGSEAARAAGPYM
jgi:hypothetical protein